MGSLHNAALHAQFQHSFQSQRQYRIRALLKTQIKKSSSNEPQRESSKCIYKETGHDCREFRSAVRLQCEDGTTRLQTQGSRHHRFFYSPLLNEPLA
jgi:hypothetical protein